METSARPRSLAVLGTGTALWAIRFAGAQWVDLDFDTYLLIPLGVLDTSLS